MRRTIVFLATLALLGLGVMAIPASAAQPKWDMTGTYTIQYFLDGHQYDHTDTITVTSYDDPMTFTGTGFYNPDPRYTETVTGTLTGDNLEFTVDYTGLNPTYALDADGTVAPDGSLSGSATSNTGQHFTWTAIGKARPFGFTTSCASGVFVSSKGGTQSLPTVPGHKYRIDVSGTYYAGGIDLYDIRADAEYSQDRAQFAAGTAWTPEVNGYPGANLLDLLVDGQGINWGAYSADHTYTVDKVAADQALSFAFNIDDSYPSNNTGGLCVSITDLGNIGTVSGFFAPVNNMPIDNVAKAGQSIPLKWRILDYNGNPVSDPSSFVSVTSTEGIGGGGTNDLLEAYAAGDSGLQYLGDGYWQFNWKTLKVWAGTGRTVTVTLSDGSTLVAEVLFK